MNIEAVAEEEEEKEEEERDGGRAALRCRLAEKSTVSPSAFLTSEHDRPKHGWDDKARGDPNFSLPQLCSIHSYVLSVSPHPLFIAVSFLHSVSCASTLDIRDFRLPLSPTPPLANRSTHRSLILGWQMMPQRSASPAACEGSTAKALPPPQASHRLRHLSSLAMAGACKDRATIHCSWEGPQSVDRLSTAGSGRGNDSQGSTVDCG